MRDIESLRDGDLVVLAGGEAAGLPVRDGAHIDTHLLSELGWRHLPQLAGLADLLALPLPNPLRRVWFGAEPQQICHEPHYAQLRCKCQEGKLQRLAKLIAIDEALHADGAILAAFGYARPVSQLDDAAELRALVTALSEAQQKMAERLAELGAEVAQLRGRTRQDVAASG